MLLLITIDKQITENMFSKPAVFSSQVKEVSTEMDPPHTESATEPENSDSCLHCALEAAMSGDKLHQVRVSFYNLPGHHTHHTKK